jgi:hypothetical protein
MKNDRKTVKNVEISCRAVRAGAWTLLLVYALGLLGGALLPSLAAEGSPRAGLGWSLLLQALPASAAGGWGVRLLGLAWSVPVWVALMFGVRALDRLLRRFEQGDYFGNASMEAFDHCATAMLGATLLAMAHGTLVPLTAGLSGLDGPLRLVLAVDLNGSDLWSLLLCALLKVLTRIMRAGGRLAQEVSEFV